MYKKMPVDDNASLVRNHYYGAKGGDDTKQQSN
jgi:hypothetical protein